MMELSAQNNEIMLASIMDSTIVIETWLDIIKNDFYSMKKLQKMVGDFENHVHFIDLLNTQNDYIQSIVNV